MMRRLYDWMMRVAGHKRAPHALFWVAFVESSIFPIPPDVMLVPMGLADRTRAWRYAAICTVGSVLGGIAGYAIGYYLLEAFRGLACGPLDASAFRITEILRSMLAFVCPGGKFEQATEWFKEWGVWILLIKGPTPFPYKILTIAAGAAHMNLATFVIASVISRSMRFFLVAGLITWFGEPIREFIERRLNLLATLFAVVLIGSFVALKYLF